jgi:purine-binding chemotaxis protein CheW
MGLPSKKQLHKHRRGTRKALDTLDALSESEQQVVTSEEDNQPTSAKKKASPGKSTKSSTGAGKAKKVTKKVTKKTTETKPMVEKKAPAEKPPQEIEGVKKSDEIKIALDMTENSVAGIQDTEPVVKPEEKVAKKKTEPVDRPEAKPEEDDISAATAEFDISHLGDLEEDTQKDRFLSFRIEKEDFGIEIKYVTEIIVMQKITEVPNTLPFIKGVINLRGKVIPVMDIRERFNLETRTYDDRTCIVVVDVNETAVGLIVDTVNEVIDIPDEKKDPPPSTHAGFENTYINGMGKIGNRVMILLDVKNILNL